MQLGHDLLPAETQVVIQSPAPNTVPADPAPSTDPQLQVGAASLRAFGDYVLLEEIARGGMGIVYKARQRSLDRVVALKRLLFGALASPEFVNRFRAEATVAGSLQHPNVVAIHEVGIYQDEHYLVMDFVAGQTLAKLVAQQPLPVKRAAAYLKTIAETVHYAHDRGILHRDLKPSNVLIDEFDQPRITDFGLAKRFDLSDVKGLTARPEVSQSLRTSATEITVTGQVLGSPSYMPPEQAAAGRDNVSRRSDVYALGAMLYHLTTGRPPFVAQTPTETLQQVLEAEPVSPRVLNPGLPRDLETITLKCLEKDPARRYPTAQALADELRRFVHDEPIHARPVNAAEKLWRWCRRRPALAMLILAVHLVGSMGLAGILWQWRRAEMSASRERHEHNVAEGRLYAAQMKLAHAAFKAGKIGDARKLLESQQPSPGQPDFRGFEWRFLYRLCQSKQSEVLSTNSSGFSAVDWSPTQRTLAVGSRDGAVELFDGQTRRRLQGWQAHEGVINDLAFCPKDANWLVTLGGDDGLLKLWDVARERVVLTTNGSKGFFPFVAFSPSGKLLVSSAPDAQSLNLWEFQSGTLDPLLRLTLRTNLPLIGPAAFSPDEQMLAACNDPKAVIGWVMLCEVNGRRVATLPTEHTDFIQFIAFSPDGRRLATGGGDERVVLWDLDRRKKIHSVTDDLINVMSGAFSADGHAIYVGGWDSNLRRWEFTKTNEMLRLRGHSGGVDAIAISSDGAVLASAGRDGTARLWDLQANEAASHSLPAEFSTLLHSEDTGPDPTLVGVVGVAVSPDGRWVVAVGNTKLWLFDLATGSTRVTASVEEVFGRTNTFFGTMATAAFSPNGRTLAVGSANGDLALLDASTLRLVKQPTRLHNWQLSHTAFGLGGTILITGGGLGTGVALSRFPEGGTLTNIVAMEGGVPVQPLAVSADGKLLATGSPEQRIRVWDLASRRIVASSPLKVRLLLSLAFSPDGQWLAIPDELGRIYLWDYRGQRPLRKLAGHAGAVLTLAFSPDGRTLASGSTDHTIKLWNPEIEQEVATLIGHTEWVWCVAFAQHGDALISCSRDGTLRLWHALPFAESASPR